MIYIILLQKYGGMGKKKDDSAGWNATKHRFTIKELMARGVRIVRRNILSFILKKKEHKL